jgi:hypothetical protein
MQINHLHDYDRSMTALLSVWACIGAAVEFLTRANATLWDE